MKTAIKAGAITAAILTLTVLTARCALIGNDVAAVEPTRIEAPREAWEQRTVRNDGPSIQPVPETGEVLTTIPSLEVATPALELMYDLPLRAQVQLEIEQMCAARDVDAAVVLGIISVESGYNEREVGDAGRSFGLMQILRECHEDRMARLGVTDLLDGVQNVRVGIDYLDELLDRYGGDYLKALTAYRAGHYGGVVSAYAYEVMAIANEMRK